MPWVGLQYVIVVFPGHTHLLVSGSLTTTDLGATIQLLIKIILSDALEKQNRNGEKLNESNFSN